MLSAGYYKGQIKKTGNALFDVDRSAERFSESSVWPLEKLLQARLLIDGGYYNQASAILLSISKSELSNPADRVEYYFRLGRLYDETGNTDKAIEFYEYTIQIGRDRTEHFAARSALQLGMLYEHSGNKDLAIAKYKECLSIRDHDFQNSLDQQAKAGINRLKNR
jgi:tetratricopeptide (TPR) repeat protein